MKYDNELLNRELKPEEKTEVCLYCHLLRNAYEMDDKEQYKKCPYRTDSLANKRHTWVSLDDCGIEYHDHTHTRIKKYLRVY